jgi:hypothetical protein
MILARNLTRLAALEDLGIALPATRLALRLLWLSSRDPNTRAAADAANQALDQAMVLLRRLR